MTVAIRGNVAVRGRVRMGGSFSPLSLNPALWLSDTGSDAGTWPDISGNNRHATQVDASKKPGLVAGVKNGRQVRRFATQDYFLITNGPTHSGEFTAFLVYKKNATGGKMELLSSSTVGTLFVFEDYIDNKIWSRGNGYRWISAAVDTYSDFVCITTSISGTTAGVWRNGQTVSVTPTAGAVTAVIDSIGFLSPNNFALGDAGEILYFQTALSPADRQAVEAYLASKWGITLA